jgi:hypothetical protein
VQSLDDGAFGDLDHQAMRRKRRLGEQPEDSRVERGI